MEIAPLHYGPNHKNGNSTYCGAYVYSIKQAFVVLKLHVGGKMVKRQFPKQFPVAVLSAKIAKSIFIKIVIIMLRLVFGRTIWNCIGF